MNNETKVMLECMKLFADYLASREKELEQTHPLRQIKIKLYNLLNPHKEGEPCCEMPEEESE